MPKYGIEIDSFKVISVIAAIGSFIILTSSGAEDKVQLELLFEKSEAISHSPENATIMSNSITIDAGGNQIVYVSHAGKGMQVTVINWTRAVYDSISKNSFVLSPVRSRFAFTAIKGSKIIAIIDGREGECYDAGGDIVSSPDDFICLLKNIITSF